MLIMLIAQYMQFIIICHTHVRRVNINILKSITLLPLEKVNNTTDKNTQIQFDNLLICYWK